MTVRPRSRGREIKPFAQRIEYIAGRDFKEILAIRNDDLFRIRLRQTALRISILAGPAPILRTLDVFVLIALRTSPRRSVLSTINSFNL
jgi:hypothetical protein